MQKHIRTFKKRHPNIDTILVLLAVIFIWRACWNMLDVYFFPDQKAISLFVPAIAGLAYLYFNDMKLDELE